MILSPRRGGRTLCLVVCSITMAGGCAGSGDDSEPQSSPLIATTNIWGDITSAVGCGTPVPALIPPGADPHTFEASLRDREVVEGATTIISNGLELETTLVDLLDSARDRGVDVIEMTDDIDVLTDDDTDRGDPHVWQDPLRVAGTVDTIASALDASDIVTCADDYRDELVRLDAEIEELLRVVPSTSRVLVTSHDSLEYFADRYDFEIVGTVIPSTNTMAESNAAHLAELTDVIEALNVPAIFTEELESTVDADALAERLGIAVIPLVTDSLTDDPATDTYVEMMRYNARAIAAALAP